MEKTDRKRRNFLRAFGWGAAAVAVGFVAGKRDMAAAQVAGSAAPIPAATNGYRLSEHVQRYYHTTRV